MITANTQIFSRDNIIWTLTFIGSVLAFAAASTHLLPDAYVDKVKDVASVLGFISGALNLSPLPLSDANNKKVN